MSFNFNLILKLKNSEIPVPIDPEILISMLDPEKENKFAANGLCKARDSGNPTI